MRTLLILLFPVLAVAQVFDNDLSPSAGEVLSMDEDNAEDGAAFENFLQFLSDPIDLNTVSPEQLALLPLSADQVAGIIRHRKENGKFLSKYELQTITELDQETLRRIADLVTVRAPSETLDRDFLRRIRKEGENYFLFMSGLSLKKKTGFLQNDQSKQFEGSRPRMLFRYRSYRPGDYSFGVTGEKDEGEKISWRPKQNRLGFDHLSFHGQVLNKGAITNLVVGDFQCQFGQGLVWGGAAGFGKGAETITSVRKPNIGLVPYTSAYESGYFRGLAATIRIKPHLHLTGILSSTRRDGNVDQQGNEPAAGSIMTTGLHRNQAELGARKTIRETIGGGVLQFRKGQLDAGIAVQALSYDFERRIRPQPYNQFTFQGKSNLNATGFLTFNANNFSFFAEYAKSVRDGDAYIAGMLVSLTKTLDLAVLHRNYSRNYHSFYGNGFSEGTSAQNEMGLYWGWKYKFNRRYAFSGYVDFFEFPWLKFRIYAPSRGSEILLRFSWQPSRTSLFYIQGRQEIKSRNSVDDSQVYQVSRITKYNYWIHFEYAINTHFKMRTRLQGSEFLNAGARTSGLLLYHDITASVSKFKLTARYALFDAKNFDNRLYAYENDVWMSFSLPAYYGQGARQFIMLQYKPVRPLTFWIRYSNTRYFNTDAVGSGLDMIDGNTRNEIKFETRLTF
jgi:hypothetical protein